MIFDFSSVNRAVVVGAELYDATLSEKFAHSLVKHQVLGSLFTRTSGAIRRDLLVRPNASRANEPICF